MREHRMVSTNMFMDSTFSNGLCVAHSEKGEDHGRGKFWTIESHGKGLEREPW